MGNLRVVDVYDGPSPIANERWIHRDVATDGERWYYRDSGPGWSDQVWMEKVDASCAADCIQELLEQNKGVSR